MVFRAFLMPLSSAPENSTSFRSVTMAAWGSAAAAGGGEAMARRRAAQRRERVVRFIVVPRVLLLSFRLRL